jgi:hypothetical protein
MESKIAAFYISWGGQSSYEGRCDENWGGDEHSTKQKIGGDQSLLGG